MIINKECFDANTDCSTSTLVCCRKCKQMFNKHPCLLQKVQTNVQQAPLLVAEKVQANVQHAPLLVAESANRCSTCTLACCRESANKCSTSTPACCKRYKQGCLYNNSRVLVQQKKKVNP